MFKENPSGFEAKLSPSKFFSNVCVTSPTRFHPRPPIRLDKPSTFSSLVLRLSHAKLGDILTFYFAELAAAVAASLQESRENVSNLSHLSAGILKVSLVGKRKSILLPLRYFG